MTEGTGTTGRVGITELLARRLADAGRGVDGRFTVAELRRSLLPYPLCRSELALATKAEYDVALLRLLHEDGLLESDDPELDEDVDRELASPEPALGCLDDHAAAALRPGRRLRKLVRPEPPAETGPPLPPDEGTTVAADAAPAQEPAAVPAGSSDDADDTRPSRTAREGADGDGGAAGVVSGADGRSTAAAACPACGGALPGADGVRFCPHCGAGVEARRCGRCGETMAAGWRYCPFCGSERHE